MDDKFSALIANLEAARIRLDAAVEKIMPQLEIYPTWQLKQLLDHITGWDELVCDILLTHQRGESLPQTAKNISKFNDQSIATRRSISLEQSRKDYHRIRVDVLHLLRNMPDEYFTNAFIAPWGGEWTVDRMLKLFASHEQEHARHIEELLKYREALG